MPNIEPEPGSFVCTERGVWPHGASLLVVLLMTTAIVIIA